MRGDGVRLEAGIVVKPGRHRVGHQILKTTTRIPAARRADAPQVVQQEQAWAWATTCLESGQGEMHRILVEAVPGGGEMFTSGYA